MYVAMTRARKNLFLTRAHTRMLHGQRRYYHSSRILDELHEENLHWLSPKPGRFNAPTGMQWAQHARSHMRQRHPQAALRSQVVHVNGNDYRIGLGVRRPKFGEGTILSVSGQGDNAQAEVHFREAGKKNLALAVAKLEVIAG